MILFMTASLLLLLLILWPSKQPVIHLTPYISESCEVSSSQASGSLSLNILGAAVVLQPLFDLLCNHSTLGTIANQISINWPNQKNLTATQLIDGHYQLIWSRPELLKAVLHNFEHYYQPLWVYPDYPVYWISSEPIPEFSRHFLQSQHIGLLSDQSSYSGYQLPIASLQSIGLSLKDVKHSFYADRISLAQAASNGEISIYPGVLMSVDGKIAYAVDNQMLFDVTGKAIANNTRVQMAGSSNGGTFYLHQSLQQHSCFFQELLGTAIASSMVHQVALPCQD